MKFKSLIFIIFFLLSLNKAYSQEKIVFVDFEFLINNSIAGEKANSFLNKQFEKKKDEFQKIEKSLIDEEKKLRSQQNLLKEEEFKKKINEFKKKYNDFTSLRQKTLQKFEKAESSARAEIVTNIQKILADYSEKNAILMILDKKNIIIGKKDFEITDQIMKNLNDNLKEVKVNLQ